MRRLLSSLFLCLPLPAGAQEFTTYKGHGGPVMGLVVTGEGTLASASFDNSVGIWPGHTPRWLEGHDAAVTVIAEAPDGALVTGGDGSAVWHWSDTPRKIGQHKGKVTSLSVLPGGAAIASGSWDGDIVLWPQGRGIARLPLFPVLDGSAIVWDSTTIDALFDQGPDHCIPGSKMPMQVIAQPQDRADLIAFLRTATNKE